MDTAYISALAALAGTAIGGLTSFATSWMTQQAQSRTQRLAAEKDKREDLFGRFLEEAAKLYTDALQNKREDAASLMVIYGLANRIRLIVIDARCRMCRYGSKKLSLTPILAPNMSLEEVRSTWVDRHVDPLRDFSEACR